MAPHFRLLRICEQVLNEGSLEGIDALLGCPLYTINDEVISKVASLSKQERETLCTCLFLAINWFREVGTSLQLVLVPYLGSNSDKDSNSS